MHVVATAGHVDHGKSTLVHALTGSDPDRLVEEHRRGLSIELGYAWTSLARVGDVAFVDVPGHERFVSTMLAGVGPVPVALLVVAADDRWMPQAAEHLAALDALGVRHGVVAVTRADLADPAAALARAAAELAGTSLAAAPLVAVSARTGQGLTELRSALVDVLAALPEPDPAADVRLWVDRRFTVRGAGSVVTGTLPAGTVARGDQLELDGSALVRVRGVQALGAPADRVAGVARVALNLTGDAVERVERGSTLTSPGGWAHTSLVDVRLRPGGRPVDRGLDRALDRALDRDPRPPLQPMLHVGATSLPVHCRPLDDRHARLSLERPLPLRIGDRALLRDPGSRRVWGVEVLDPAPPALRRRGAAAARAAVLADVAGAPDAAGEVRRRGLVEAARLRRLGVPVADGDAVDGVVAADGWLLSGGRAAEASRQAVAEVREHDRAQPLDPGVALPVLAERLGLPTAGLAAAVVRPPLQVVGGRVRLADATPTLPAALLRSLAAIEADLADAPFAAPTADRLREVGLDARSEAAAAKAGRLLRVAPGIVLMPDAPARAATLLQELDQPFTTSAARQALGTSRRVALPLLDHLDRTGVTERLPDDTRRLR